MKILIQAIAVALVIGSAGTASAHHVKSHRHAGGSSTYDALAPNARTLEPSIFYWGFSYQTDTDPHATATGGPVGGLGS